MKPYIVADIGGTNARFGLVTKILEGLPVIEKVLVLDGSSYGTLQEAMHAYIEHTDIASPQAACVAIAGPVVGDAARMTNLDWAFSQQAVKKEFGFERFAAINDFASLSIATSLLREEDLIPLKSGQREAQGNKAVLGPGTGLGVGGLAHNGTAWLPIPSEGGHVNIAPATPLECEVVKVAMEQHAYVSAEIFISGPGIVNLYEALAVVRGEKPEKLKPKEISAAAIDNSNALCKETLSLFCNFIGSLSGNLALTYGAKGGVYLAGGILPRFVDFIRGSDFNNRFSQKGVMSHYVENIPVDIIGHAQPGLLGSAAWLAQGS